MNLHSRINQPEFDGCELVGDVAARVVKDAIMRAYEQGVFDAHEAIDLIFSLGLKNK